MSVRLSDAVFDMSERDKTVSEPESAPDSDQPPSPDVPVAFTFSLKPTVIVLRVPDSAETILGPKPSDGFAEYCFRSLPAASSRLPLAA